MALTTAGVVGWLFWPRAVPVDFAVATIRPLEVTVGHDGEARVKDVYVVSAPLAGLMRRITLKAGDEVVANETVAARLEPSDPAFLDERSEATGRAAVVAAEAARKAADASVQRAAAERDYADIELKRYRKLAERGSITRSELDAAIQRARMAAASHDEARASLRMRTAELARAKARLLTPELARERPDDDCRCIDVVSPVSGVVLRVVNPSEAVVGAGTPLLEVGNPLDLEIAVDLLSSDAVQVRPGQLARIEAWGGAPVAGRVRRVEPYGFTKVSALGIEEQRVNVLIDLTDPRARFERLGHGYRVEPKIIIAQAERALVVPRAAVFRDGERWSVFVNEAGRAALRHIDLGLETGLEVEVRTGLAVGDAVVLQPGDRVEAGTKLVARKE
jgi:HlyD family secretion protein